MTLEELLERLEKAEGPDRELDADLWWHFDRRSAGMNYHHASFGKPVPLPDKRPATGLGGAAIKQNAPAFTGSLDAAVAFKERVLPGWYETITSGTLPTGGYSVQLTPHYALWGPATKHKTRALALCTAVVKALIEMEKGPAA